MDTKWYRRPWAVWVLGTLVVLVVLSIVVAALWRLPWFLDHHYLKGVTQAQAATVSGMRTTLLAILAGILAVVGVVYTHLNLQHTKDRDHREAELTREAQVTDRYTKAIGQIASTSPVEQLGGIYALERIMRDSEKDHSTIVEVLAAFVREHTPPPTPKEPSIHERVHHARRRLRLEVQGPTPSIERGGWPSVERRSTEPVQAAVTVLGRRPLGRTEPFRLNLARTNLRSANLRQANLERADLSQANLERADLDEAQLEGADLSMARLAGADLRDANLEGCGSSEGKA